MCDARPGSSAYESARTRRVGHSRSLGGDRVQPTRHRRRHARGAGAIGGEHRAFFGGCERRRVPAGDASDPGVPADPLRLRSGPADTARSAAPRVSLRRYADHALRADRACECSAGGTRRSSAVRSIGLTVRRSWDVHVLLARRRSTAMPLHDDVSQRRRLSRPRASRLRPRRRSGRDLRSAERALLLGLPLSFEPIAGEGGSSGRVLADLADLAEGELEHDQLALRIGRPLPRELGEDLIAVGVELRVREVR